MTDTIVLLAAVRHEIAPCAALLSLRRCGIRYTGCVDGRRIVAMISGVGETRAVRALEDVVGAERPARLVHLGFAGALNPALRVGDVPEFSGVVDESGGRVGIGVEQPQARPKVEATGDGPTLLTAQQLADSTAMKRKLFERHGACAVDMETYAVARRAAEMALPLTVLRAISDDADTVVPAAALSWVNADGSIDAWAATRHLARRPWLVGPVMRLKQGCDRAAERLATRVAEMLAR